MIGDDLTRADRSVWRVVDVSESGQLLLSCLRGSRRPGVIGDEESGRSAAVRPEDVSAWLGVPDRV